MDTVVVKEAPAQPSDNDIINQTLGGDNNAFGELVKRYNSRLYRIGMAIIGNDSEIEDTMQNAYVKAYRNLDKFEHRALFSTWLTKIMVNECLQSVKKKKRHMSIEGLSDAAHLLKVSLPNEPKTPASIAVNNELGKALEHALFELPEKYRIVFVMREMECMSITETRDALDLSESNVKIRLNRAKAMLRSNLHEFYRSETILQFYLTRCNRVRENVLARIQT